MQGHQQQQMVIEQQRSIIAQLRATLASPVASQAVKQAPGHSQPQDPVLQQLSSTHTLQPALQTGQPIHSVPQQQIPYISQPLLSVGNSQQRAQQLHSQQQSSVQQARQVPQQPYHFPSSIHAGVQSQLPQLPVQYFRLAHSTATIPKFWGEQNNDQECSDTLLNWIQDVREVQDVQQWTDVQTFKKAKRALQGKAKNKYRTMFTGAKTLENLQRFLHQRLTPRNPQEHFFDLLIKTRQKASESVSDFNSRFQRAVCAMEEVASGGFTAMMALVHYKAALLPRITNL
jgi:hypothetical protein